MAVRQRFGRCRILYALGMRRKRGTVWTDIEARHVVPEEGLCYHGMDSYEQSYVRLLANREPQTERPMRRQVADEGIGERLADFRVIFLV
jgi:hypothetical protein